MRRLDARLRPLLTIKSTKDDDIAHPACYQTETHLIFASTQQFAMDTIHYPQKKFALPPQMWCGRQQHATNLIGDVVCPAIDALPMGVPDDGSNCAKTGGRKK